MRITRKTCSLAGQAIAVRVSGVPDPDSVSVSPLNYGVACKDNATGSGYLMYSEESVHTRFAAVPPNSNNANHFICVRYSNGVWQYDNNNAYTAFTPQTSDVLAASINFSADVITSLEGGQHTMYGITAGYASGDLVYAANMWAGSSNSGEFGISGSGFTPVNEGNGLFYIHSDHLGSTSTLSDVNGAQVGPTTRYTPFGDYRPGSSQSDITDRGFTGHKENRSIGLTYMNARYYLPSTGRFLSADTIVPDPTNPQSLNRYTYVLNSPLIYIDPTGHKNEYIEGESLCLVSACSEGARDQAIKYLRRFGVEAIDMTGLNHGNIAEKGTANGSVIGNMLDEAGNGLIHEPDVVLDIFESFTSSIDGTSFGGVAFGSDAVKYYIDLFVMDDPLYQVESDENDLLLAVNMRSRTPIHEEKDIYAVVQITKNKIYFMTVQGDFNSNGRINTNAIHVGIVANNGYGMLGLSGIKRIRGDR